MQKNLIVTPIKIHFAVIWIVWNPPPRNVLMVNFSHQIEANLIRKWKETGSLKPRKVLEGFKSLQYPSKKIADEIKQYSAIDMHPASVWCILIKFGHQFKMKHKNASNSCNEGENISIGTSSSKLVHLRLEKCLMD